MIINVIGGDQFEGFPNVLPTASYFCIYFVFFFVLGVGGGFAKEKCGRKFLP